jgi:hypothetical protein
MSLYAVVVISLLVGCVIVGIYVGVSNFKKTVVGSLLNDRNTEYGREEYTRCIISRKGYKKRAESIMRDAYNDIMRNVGKYTNSEKNRVLNNAYRRALDLSKEYIDEVECAYIKKQPSYVVDGLSCLYKKFYGDAFDPNDKI